MINMNCRVGKIKTFWLLGTDNKPSFNYFQQLIANLTPKELYLNWIDNRTIQITLPKLDINYIEVNSVFDVNKKMYYFFNRVLQKINNGFVCEFIIDIYASITLPLLENLKNTNVKVIRSHYLSDLATQYEDKLLDDVEKVYSGTQFAQEDVINFKYRTPIGGGDKMWFAGKVQSGYEAIANGTLYFVFNFSGKELGYATLGQTPNSFAFFPVLFEVVDRNKNKIAFDGNTYEQTYNNIEDLTYLAQYHSPKFVGAFILPSAYHFDDFKKARLEVGRTGGSNPTPLLENFAYITFEFDKGKKFNNVHGLNVNFGNFIEWTVRPYFNQSDKLHKIAAKYINLTYYGNPINASDLLVGVEQCIFNFSMSGYYGWKNKYTFMENNILKLPDNLPVGVDEYTKYVNSTRNQRDTGLNATANNAIIGTFSSLLGIGTSIASGSIGGALSGVLGLGNTITSAVQANKMVQAQLKDARYQKGTSFNFACNKEFILTKTFPFVSTEKPYPDTIKVKGLGSYWNTLTPDTIKSLNNIIYWYGCFTPLIKPLNQFLSVNSDFNYIQLDYQYLINILNSNEFWANTQKDFYEEALNFLISGIRLWNIQPTN